jgi:hypothetical protein
MFVRLDRYLPRGTVIVHGLLSGSNDEEFPKNPD